MADSSRIGAAQDGLLTILQARNILKPDGKKVPLGLGWPKKGPIAPEHIWIAGTVDDWEQEWETTGPVNEADREERFTLRVHCLVTRKDDWKAARDRALVLAREIELAARTDDTLGAAVFESEFVGTKFDEGFAPSESQAMVSAGIRCRAYLSG